MKGFFLRKMGLCPVEEREKALGEIRFWKEKWRVSFQKTCSALDERDRWRERAYRYAEEAMVWKEKYLDSLQAGDKKRKKGGRDDISLR